MNFFIEKEGSIYFPPSVLYHSGPQRRLLCRPFLRSEVYLP